MAGKLNSAYWWLPSLYFIEGLPYFIVNQISIVMFTDLGLSKAQMAFFTSLLYLPWVIKPFWSPFIDIFKSKKWWIIAMQTLMAVSFLLVAFSIPKPSSEMISDSSAPLSLFTISLGLFFIVAFASATNDIASDAYYIVQLSQREQSFFVGIRSTFYRLSSWLGQAVIVALAAFLERNMEAVISYTQSFLHIEIDLSREYISLSWQIVFVLLAILFSLFSLYHIFVLKKDSSLESYALGVKGRAVKDIFTDFVQALSSFFAKKQILIALSFILLFRLPEALMLKLIYPFFTDSLEAGGLGLSAETYAVVYSTCGVIALTLGGILGGVVAAKYGLKKVLWCMFFALIAPSLLYVYLSIYPLADIYILSSLVAIEQFGYGFGFQAYLLYMLFFSRGAFSASHYAVCTGFMALGMMLPGLFAGFLYEHLGYVGFFSLSMLTSVFSFIATAFVYRSLSE